MGVRDMMSRVVSLILVALVAACLGGGGQQEDGPKNKYASKVGTTKQAGVMRCDPFGDYGAFWGVTSDKFDGKLATISNKKRTLKSYKGKSLLVANIAANADDAATQMQNLHDIAESY